MEILGTLTLGGAPLVPIVEDDGVLPPLDRRAQIHVNRTDAAERRRGQPTNFGTTVEINEYDFIPGGVVGQRNTAAEREEIARPSGSIEPGEFRARREIM